MKIYLKILIFGAFLALAQTTIAQEIDFKGDGNDLLNYCKAAIRILDGKEDGDDQQLVKTAYCFGFVGGMFFGGSLVGNEPKNHPVFCPPPTTIKASQLARITVKWLKEHPEILHLNGGALVLRALEEAFPCQKEAPSP